MVRAVPARREPGRGLAGPKAGAALNDLRVYDQKRAWWDHSDPVLEPLHRLVPARMQLLSQYDWDGEPTLDVGCGGGYMSRALAEAGADVVGVDIAERALEAAREAVPQARFVCAGADALPFPDDSFRRVVCTDVLVHVPDPWAVLPELARVLAPGGLAFLSAINRNPLASLIMVTLGEGLGFVHRGTHDPRKFLRPDEVAAGMAAAGLHLHRQQGLGPTGWRRGFTFGRHPTAWVMYQQVFTAG